MARLARRIARWLSPFVLEDLSPYLQSHATSLRASVQVAVENGVIARQMVEELANALGKEATFDPETLSATIHDLK